MWPFGNRNRAAADPASVAAYEEKISDLEESVMNLLQSQGEAETRMKAMQRPMSEEGMEDIGKEVAAQVADIYARGGSSVATRDNAVASVVVGMLRKALTGTKEKW